MAEAVAAAGTLEIEAAILDVNINGEQITPVVEVLDHRGIPMVFSTGYGRTGIDARWRDRPVLQKPYRLDELAAAIRTALGRGAGRPAAQSSAESPR
jgi:DNA-binding response OmpR family regulator